MSNFLVVIDMGESAYIKQSSAFPTKPCYSLGLHLPTRNIAMLCVFIYKQKSMQLLKCSYILQSFLLAQLLTLFGSFSPCREMLVKLWWLRNHLGTLFKCGFRWPQDSAFLISSQIMMMLLVQAPSSEKQVLKKTLATHKWIPHMNESIRYLTFSDLHLCEDGQCFLQLIQSSLPQMFTKKCALEKIPSTATLGFYFWKTCMQLGKVNTIFTCNIVTNNVMEYMLNAKFEISAKFMTTNLKWILNKSPRILL